jgi:hypothetical protein
LGRRDCRRLVIVVVEFGEEALQKDDALRYHDEVCDRTSGKSNSRVYADGVVPVDRRQGKEGQGPSGSGRKV